ncbi:hypothetical protein PABG_12257 [Paracoccidioides brasiliensis Pb03]|nr:hypothetical protein PABG_12257 [Paracoccidioides brasiliensis Pb03]
MAIKLAVGATQNKYAYVHAHTHTTGKRRRWMMKSSPLQ